MNDDAFDINALSIKAGLIILAVSLAVAFFFTFYFIQDRGRIVFFSTMMSLVSIYTANGMLKYAGAKAFLLAYIGLHVGLVALPFTHDTDYAGPILFPFVIADYVAMVFVLRKCTFAWMK